MANSVGNVNRQISLHFKIVEEEIEKAVRDALRYIGELISSEAKAQDEDISWYNQTGNLRSSVGCGLYKKGKLLLYGVFEQVLITATEGVDTGIQLLKSLEKTYNADYTEVIVAAMEYAGYVEAMANKQVLAGVWAKYRSQIEPMLQRVIQEAEARINARLQ